MDFGIIFIIVTAIVALLIFITSQTTCEIEDGYVGIIDKAVCARFLLQMRVSTPFFAK